jgi:hypothetical protein
VFLVARAGLDLLVDHSDQLRYWQHPLFLADPEVLVVLVARLRYLWLQLILVVLDFLEDRLDLLRYWLLLDFLVVLDFLVALLLHSVQLRYLLHLQTLALLALLALLDFPVVLLRQHHLGH